MESISILGMGLFEWVLLLIAIVIVVIVLYYQSISFKDTKEKIAQLAELMKNV